MRLYAQDAAHTFDGAIIVTGIPAISAAFDRGFAGSYKLGGTLLSSMLRGDTALLRVRWRVLDADAKLQRESVSLEVLAKGADGLWRYILDDATGGNRPA